ncbi:MAG: hypothetical protein K2G03_03700 [Bacilli bacterium]|nr:hypothetical protein [Bacilli bacterium]
MENKEEIVKIVISELVDRGFIKKDINTFERTKEVLRKYKRIEQSIKGIDKQIKKLEKDLESTSGLKPNMKRSNALIDPFAKSKPSDYDSIYSRIGELESSKIKINVFLDYVKSLVKENTNVEDYDLLDRLYFTASDNAAKISEELDCNTATIYRRVNKIVDKIHIELFPDLFIDQLCK